MAWRNVLLSPRFVRQAPLQSKAEITRWWERRRLFYNTMVLTAMLCTVASLAAIGLLGGPVEMPRPPVFVAFDLAGYLIAANLLYTLGPVAERLARRVWGGEASSAFGQIAFGLGAILSLIVTLLPIPLTLAVWTYLALTTES